jgi:hypothetical protein
MPIDNVPAVQDVIEQQNLLERAFQLPLEAGLAYSRIADDEMFPNGVGETITKTRPALFPLAAAFTPINPSGNTGIDNGMSDSYYTFEQYQLPISEWALSTTVNINQDYTLIQRTFLQNYAQLGENAGRTIDGLCAQQVHKAYDGGNTFATAAASGSTLHLDNAYGFNTTFSATNSPGLPTSTSASNPVQFNVYAAGTGVLKGQGTATGVTFDATNISTAFVGGIAYGASGTLTGVTYTATAVAAGDQIIATDGSVVARPGGLAVNSRYQLASTNILTLQVIANAVAKLRARNVKPLPSGNYLCIMDPTLWPQLLSDSAFNYATMGQMGEGYFARGMVNRTLGVEFIDSNLVPAYNLPAAGAADGAGFARHCVVGGQGLLIKGTFQGSIDSARQANTMQNADIRWIEDAKISLITRGPLDRLQEFVTQSWKWIGGFVSPTDVTSTPLIIPTTDYARYKRAVVVEVYSAS